MQRGFLLSSNSTKLCSKKIVLDTSTGEISSSAASDHDHGLDLKVKKEKCIETGEISSSAASDHDHGPDFKVKKEKYIDGDGEAAGSVTHISSSSDFDVKFVNGKLICSASALK